MLIHTHPQIQNAIYLPAVLGLNIVGAQYFEP